MLMRKLSISVPAVLVEDLNYLSRRMKVSKSALIANLNVEPIHDMRMLLESVPENPTEEDLIRSRGASADLVKKRISNLSKLVDGDDLFSE